MSRSLFRAAKLAVLFTAMRTLLLSGGAVAAQQPVSSASTDSAASQPWGDVTDGLQLRVDAAGKNTESLTETVSQLYLMVQMRNVSNRPAAVDLTSAATYDFEYEIDGTWYGFERMAPIRTPLSVMYANLRADMRSDLQTLAAGSERWTILTLPLAGRSRSLRLYALTMNGPARQFEPTPGAHVLRVRPGRALEPTRQGPVSNAVTVSLRTPAQIDTRTQTVSFTASRGTPLEELRFVKGPEGGEAFIRDVLARPPVPATAPRLITSATLDILEPLPFYELVLPRRVNAASPALPATTTAFHYLVRAPDQIVGTIGLAAYPQGPALNWIGPPAVTEPLFRALQQLATLEQVRGGRYEPRLLRVTGVRGTTPLLVLWLRSSSGRPDLFFRPPDPDFRGSTKVEIDRVYLTDEFLAAARTLPVSPRYDEAWAIAAASACAKGMEPARGALIFDQGVAEVGLSDGGDHVVWYVYFPERLPAGVFSTPTGAAFYVDEANGTCRRGLLE